MHTQASVCRPMALSWLDNTLNLVSIIMWSWEVQVNTHIFVQSYGLAAFVFHTVLMWAVFGNHISVASAGNTMLT